MANPSPPQRPGTLQARPAGRPAARPPAPEPAKPPAPEPAKPPAMEPNPTHQAVHEREAVHQDYDEQEPAQLGGPVRIDGPVRVVFDAMSSSGNATTSEAVKAINWPAVTAALLKLLAQLFPADQEEEQHQGEE